MRYFVRLSCPLSIRGRRPLSPLSPRFALSSLSLSSSPTLPWSLFQCHPFFFRILTMVFIDKLLSVLLLCRTRALLLVVPWCSCLVLLPSFHPHTHTPFQEYIHPSIHVHSRIKNNKTKKRVLGLFCLFVYDVPTFKDHRSSCPRSLNHRRVGHLSKSTRIETLSISREERERRGPIHLLSLSTTITQSHPHPHPHPYSYPHLATFVNRCIYFRRAHSSRFQIWLSCQHHKQCLPALFFLPLHICNMQ
ncbi:MAG: hypothetical protein BYD32DRAFT_262902 [Podila humilis]|nr:MAG: hypothetical protein BYD32DRAFT_262902 [Podila humilis]